LRMSCRRTGLWRLSALDENETQRNNRKEREKAAPGTRISAPQISGPER
jgi:hypothetical protein